MMLIDVSLGVVCKASVGRLETTRFEVYVLISDGIMP